MTIGTEEPLAVAVVEAIHAGDLPALELLLAESWSSGCAVAVPNRRASSAG